MVAAVLGRAFLAIVISFFCRYMSKFTSVVVGAMVLGAAIAPAVASAQGTGNAVVTVYVQVTAPSDNMPYRAPSDFGVLVSGQSPSPATFAGSKTGTQVSVGEGSFAVVLTGNSWGYAPTYSQGCSGTIMSGQTGLCIITVSPTYVSYPYPAPYPYPYNSASLSCTPATQTAGLGQSVSFSAQGGMGGTYNWMVPSRNFPNAGPTLTTSFDASGSQLVSVTNGSQTATCVVNITNSYYPQPANPVYQVGGVSVGPVGPTLFAQYPRLPNTGVEPLTALQFGLALALLAGVALVASPYARKAFAIVTR